MKHLGLFEGIGGFSLAAKWMGWDTVAWCEIDAFCQTVLKYYFPKANAHGDIRETNFTQYAGQIDIITGGFPCQPYSVSGKQLGDADERHLWPEMLRCIREVRPSYVVGENVLNFTTWGGGVVFEQVLSDLENEGYEVWPVVIPACGVNAPHQRYRIWIVAYANGRGYKKFDTSDQSIASRHNTGQSVENAFADAFSKRRVQRNGGAQTIEPTQCVSDWQKFPTEPAICRGNDGISGKLVGITVPRHRRESIKAYGNAIVPQIAYQIFKALM